MPLVVMEDRSGSGLDRQARERTQERAAARLASVQDNVRNALRFEFQTPASSVYSRSPDVRPSATPQVPHLTVQTSSDVQPSPPLPTSYNTKPPMVRSLFGLVPRTGNTPILRHMPAFSNPFARGETQTYSPAAQPSEWGRSPMPAQPSPIAQTDFRHPADTVPILNQNDDLEAQLPPRRKKHKRRHHRRPNGQWTRHRKTQGGSRTCAALFQGETRSKAIGTVIAGVMLVILLTMYLSIAISVKNLNQQVHILFVLVVVAALVFFVYSLTRLISVVIHRRRNPHRHRPHIPSVAGPEGFKPDVPIPVQLARDEEAMWDDEKAPEEKESLKQPPPAYGLWRGSVRLDPNLLHWQRVEAREQQERDQRGSPSGSRNGSPSLSQRGSSPQGSPQLGSVAEEQGEVRRPPSYASDDGVSYVVSALPPAPPSEIHPAFRIRL